MPQHIQRTPVRVSYGDTDSGGVVYNANYLRYFEVGRTELMRDRVCSYKAIEKLGFILPVTECWARYKSPAFYDDLLIVETTVAEVNRYTCKFNYKVCREEQGETRPRLLAKGFTVHAAITKEGKLTRLPEDIIAKITALTDPARDGELNVK